MSDYRQNIEDIFDYYNLTPRERQVDIINDILTLFIDEKKKNVVLSASTGIGKSLIAILTSELLYNLTNENTKNNRKTSFIVAHTNTLLQQYEDSYSDKFNMLKVNGAVNYECKLLSSKSYSATAEECVNIKGDLTDKMKKYCPSCKYYNMKKLINTSNHVISNYAYIYTSNLYSNHLNERLITIWDEAHGKNDIYVNFLKIEINVKLLNKYYDECKSEQLTVADKFPPIIEKIKNKEIDNDNYMDYLEDLCEIYGIISSDMMNKADIERADENFPEFKRCSKIYKKFKNLKQKIDDFFELGYEHVIDFKYDSITISPIFMHDLFDRVNNSEYNLFMSATIDEELIHETLNLESIGFVNGGSIFDPDNKKIIDCSLEGFNYTKMQNTDFMNDIGDVVNDIVDEYNDCKGLILVTSFAQLEFVEKHLNDYISVNNIGVKIFAQQKRKGLNNVLQEFQKYKNPSVLISPSIFEGVSLDDDLARYIIFFKAPYPSLGDTRNKYIINNYPEIYEKTTVYKLIQGVGRAVRNEDDWCDTFLLDGNLKRLFKSKHNLWKNEFKQYVRSK